MQPSQSPFHPAWWGPALPGIRPHTGTFGRYDYDELHTPPDVSFDSAFTWLRHEPTQPGNILEDDRCNLPASFADLSSHAASAGVTLPPAFP